MRRFRLDEIPQLINVLKRRYEHGRPRPENEKCLSKTLAKEIPYYQLRLLSPGPHRLGTNQQPYAGNNVQDIKKNWNTTSIILKTGSIFYGFIDPFDNRQSHHTRKRRVDAYAFGDQGALFEKNCPLDPPEKLFY